MTPRIFPRHLPTSGALQGVISPTSGGVKKRRFLSLEDQLEENAKKMSQLNYDLVESLGEKARLERDLEKKKRLDAFVEMISDACMICHVGLDECVGEANVGIASYECRCSKKRSVHLGCFTRVFTCVCGQGASLHLKSSSGKTVVVSVDEEEDDDSGVDSGVDSGANSDGGGEVSIV